MAAQQRTAASIFDTSRRLKIGLLCAALFVMTVLAQAQTYTVLHNFTGGADGAQPFGTLTLDFGGNIYGTASAGGNTTGSGCTIYHGCGTVFKLAK